MTKVTLKDGSIVELTLADSYGGPGNCFSKMHVNSTVPFYRVEGGEWKHCPEFKSLHKVAKALEELCDKLEDVDILLG